MALEVLYSLDAGELTHKLSTRAAYFLGPGSAEDRVDVFDAVHDLYEVRSSIVHGRGRMDRAERERAQQVAKRGFEIGRESLVVLLNRRVEPNWKTGDPVGGGIARLVGMAKIAGVSRRGNPDGRYGIHCPWRGSPSTIGRHRGAGAHGYAGGTGPPTNGEGLETSRRRNRFGAEMDDQAHRGG